MDKNKRPILITGTHRAGTTWVGKIIALSKDIGYISEPFSLHHRYGIFNYNIEYWFQYIYDVNEADILIPFQNMLNFKYNLSPEIRTVKSLKDFLRMIRDFYVFNSNHIVKKRPLIKESLAFFSAPWISLEFSANILIMIRHPAAFIGSLKKGNTKFPFKNLLLQEKLMEEILTPFKYKIEEYSKREYSIINQGILLWNIFHYVIFEYKKNIIIGFFTVMKIFLMTQ